MVTVTGPGASVEGIRRMYELYTPTLSVLPDNDLVFVVVLDITGRGILVSLGAEGDDDNNKLVKITIDGAVIFDDVMSSQESAGTSITLMQGFATDCKVEMKLGAAVAGQFWGYALVE